jgi:carboxypeptidase Q
MTRFLPPSPAALSLSLALLVGGASWAAPSFAQSIPADDPILDRIWTEATENSELERLGLQLLDSIGPRLTSSPGMDRAHDWAVRTLQGWGIEARNEPYGTWRGWDRGPTHIDLVAPRVRSLEGMMSAWSPPTDGPVEGPVVVLPEWETREEFDAWLAREVPGSFVAIAFPQPTCRPDSHYAQFGTEGALERMQSARQAAAEAFQQRLPGNANEVRLLLEEAGAAGILQSNWPGDIGIQRVFGTNTERTPTLELSCEDYGLVARLAENGMGPRLRVNASSEALGEVPVYNTIGVIPGSDLADEYVLLSAHFDSWDGASGATDNGTGSILMLETMRILSQVYPNPRRTIMIALWGGEEQGLNGSRRFAAMNPDIVENLQALFNQDNGTGRVINISTQGLVEAGAHWGRWLSRIPEEVTRHVTLQLPGIPGAGGTDHAAFICSGAPGFNLSAHPWSYFTHTWHTNRDTFDKVVFEEVRSNAVLVASLAYLASEDPERVSRERRVLPVSPQTGEQMTWPACQPGQERFPG